MMTATGMLFLGKTGVLATTASDGTFALTVLAFDRIGPHQVEPWRITWSGDAAREFWDGHRDTLKPGQPLEVAVARIRTFSGGRFGAAESHATASSIQLAPLSRENGPQPAKTLRGQLSEA